MVFSHSLVFSSRLSPFPRQSSPRVTSSTSISHSLFLLLVCLTLVFNFFFLVRKIFLNFTCAYQGHFHPWGLLSHQPVLRRRRLDLVSRWPQVWGRGRDGIGKRESGGSAGAIHCDRRRGAFAFEATRSWKAGEKKHYSCTCGPLLPHSINGNTLSS